MGQELGTSVQHDVAGNAMEPINPMTTVRTGVAWDRQGAQQASWRLIRLPAAGTDGAGCHKITGVLGHDGPPEMLLEKIQGAMCSGVAGKLR